MNENQLKLLSDNYNIKPSKTQLNQWIEWEKLFIEYNLHTNLMSKKETGNLFGKHVYDSLAISLTNEFKKAGKILDVGTGGGFPSVILAIFYPDKKIYANDSVGKKIKFIELAREKLNLKNLYPVLGRSESIPANPCDIVTSRAVGKIKDVYRASKKHIKKGGSFIIYKALDVEKETGEALELFPELKPPSILTYSLPLDVSYTRKLVIFNF